MTEGTGGPPQTTAEGPISRQLTLEQRFGYLSEVNQQSVEKKFSIKRLRNQFRKLLDGSWLGEKDQPTKPVVASESIAANEIDANITKKNEDSCFVHPSGRLTIVCDGMGGLANGDRASQTAIEKLSTISDSLFAAKSIGEAKQIITHGIQEAHKAVKKLQETLGRFDGSFGTTVALCFIFTHPDGNQEIVTANVGDSRVSIFSSGRLDDRTIDDGAYLINIHNDNKKNEQARVSNLVDEQSIPNRDDLVQYLGASDELLSALTNSERSVKPHVETYPIISDKFAIIGSDGLFDNLTSIEITEILKNSKNAQEAKDRLMLAAKKRMKQKNHPRSKVDDLTVIVIDLVEEQRRNALRVGDQVWVERSNGDSESNWYISDINEKTGVVLVTKDVKYEVGGELPPAKLYSRDEAKQLRKVAKPKPRKFAYQS